jgi:hypothetical protein
VRYTFRPSNAKGNEVYPISLWKSLKPQEIMNKRCYYG